MFVIIIWPFIGHFSINVYICKTKDEFTMINSDKFAERLKLILDFYQLSASGVAEKIEVQKSSISHLRSGRNKPSLDFVMKVVKNFEEVELYWLHNGKGKFPNTQVNSGENLNRLKLSEEIVKSKSFEPLGSNSVKEIERIVVFYKDGTFKNYLP